MATWKELGEVPDSEEEEGFDSQDLDGQRPAFVTTTAAAATATSTAPAPATTTTDCDQSRDIWDIPSSGEPDAFNKLPKEAAMLEKQSTASDVTKDVTSRKDIWDPPSSYDCADDGRLDDEVPTISTPKPSTELMPSDLMPSATSSQLDSPLTTAPPSSEDVSSPIRPPSEAQNSPAGDTKGPNATRLQIPIYQNGDLGASENSGESHQEQRPSGISSELAVAREAQQLSVRYERSLRPRKPIQEHPYLLENAQYSTFLRQHGIKPVRMAEGPAPTRQGEESQDAEFTQESQGEAVVPEESDESQRRGVEDILDESQFVLLSPSPPKTSPQETGVEASSLPNSQATQDTFDDDDDLPDIYQVLKLRPIPRSPVSKPGNRSILRPQSAPRKRKLQDAFSIRRPAESPDPLNSSPAPMDIDPTPVPDTHNATDTATRGTGRPLLQSPASSPKFQLQMLEISSDDDNVESVLEASNGPQIAHDSQSQSEDEALVTRIGKRIRGVLPASWLRLDQQTSRDKAQFRVQKNQQYRVFDQGSKRGVAQPRQAVPGSSMSAHQLIFEDSEDEAPETEAQRPPLFSGAADSGSLHQTRLTVEPNLIEDDRGLSSDDHSSAMEVDSIEAMLPRRQRQLRLAEAFDGSRKRKRKPPSQTARVPMRRQKQQQARITSLLQEAPSRKKTRRPPSGKIYNGPSRIAPPLLSILDVIQEDAPRFIKIAARTVRRRPSQGRSSVHSKSIRLASRQDHVDASSVLQAWREGLVKQRQVVTAACQSKAKKPRQPGPPQPPRPPAGHSANRGIQVALEREARGEARRLERQISQKSTLSSGTRPEPNASIKNRISSPRDASTATFPLERPAQLEITEAEATRILRFSALKRILDRSHKRRARGGSSAASVQSLENVIDAQATVENGETPPDQPRGNGEDSRIQSKAPRARKRKKPIRVDIEAPHYLYVDDPLPTAYAPEPDTGCAQIGLKKLEGLGPYGTRYTHHFEVFPLDGGVFFHETTLLGRGVINICLSNAVVSRLGQPRPRVHFSLGQQVLRWGSWDDQTSSELGILFDAIAEEIESTTSVNETSASDDAGALGAANFVLRYVTEALSADQETILPAIIIRFHQVLSSFCERLRPRVPIYGGNQPGLRPPVLEILDRLLLVSLFILRLCQADAARLQEQMLMDQTIRALARILLSILTKDGLSQLSSVYNDLARPSVRDRGLRNDVPALHSGTLLMKVLQAAQIPRCTFWDVLEEVVDLPGALTSLNVRRHERVWETMFKLLPMSEFNDLGIVKPGQRHRAAVDGWAIPQKLIRGVFDVYQENDRQAPSFNNYCCALVGRCQYLLQRWGWHRAAPAIGVIFDFFGTQNFAHLRNEEVYTSPPFLNELAKSPSLDIEASDRCFHMFLKLLAQSVCELRKSGLEKDIRNLVARTIPNHNRQYLREQTIHERDLAALRNQHDLIVTLYWACPPKLRPSVALLERLVTPEESHKEVCLISLRAWSQLARFAVATGEATTFPRQFGSWRNAFFLKMLQQFDSVASDIQQQLSSLSKDVRDSINQDVVSAMIAMNKAAARDLLVASLAASLDVMRHAPDLEAASFCFSSSQLQHVFRYFAASPPELDWAMLRIALSILGTFLCKIEELKDNEESQQNESQMLNSAQADDALMVIDNDLSRAFFLMTRCLIASEGDTSIAATSKSDRIWCVKEAVVLSARLGVRFIDGGIMRISDMFQAGKYSVFRGLPRSLDLNQRRYLPVFLSHLLKQGFGGFADANFSLAEVWTLSLVKPREYLEYEYQFAEQLHQNHKDFVPEAVAGLSIRPDYGSNRDLFEFAISTFRRGIREAHGPSLRKVLVREYADILEAAMAQMKADLQAVADNDSERHSFVIFVRQIISLIKVHGSEYCSIDDFFYKVSKEYSPSKEDPQLYVAGMISYGVRLQEGDSKVANPLFYLLYNNFKFALAGDKLGDDVKMLVKGMRHEGIFSFMLGRMLPSVIRAAFSTLFGFVLMDSYLQALKRFMQRKVVVREISEGDLPHVATTLEFILCEVNNIQNAELVVEDLSRRERHLVKQSLALINTLWPLMFEFCIAHPETEGWKALVRRLQSVGAFVASWTEALSNSLKQIGETVIRWPGRQALDDISPETYDPCIRLFIANIVEDIERNWVYEGSRIVVHTPGQPKSTPKDQHGVEVLDWDDEQLVRDMFEEARECSYWYSRLSGALEYSEAYHQLSITGTHGRIASSIGGIEEAYHQAYT